MLDVVFLVDVTGKFLDEVFRDAKAGQTSFLNIHNTGKVAYQRCYHHIRLLRVVPDLLI